MAMSRKLAELLAARHLTYRTVMHNEACTSQEVAQAAHVPGNKMAKVVALRDDPRALSAVSGHHELRLATEREIERRFPDAEAGAMPPFESLYRVPVFIDLTFADTREIFFEDGTHRGVVGMQVEDYMRAAEPIVGRFAQEPAFGH